MSEFSQSYNRGLQSTLLSSFDCIFRDTMVFIDVTTNSHLNRVILSIILVDQSRQNDENGFLMQERIDRCLIGVSFQLILMMQSESGSSSSELSVFHSFTAVLSLCIFESTIFRWLDVLSSSAPAWSEHRCYRQSEQRLFQLCDWIWFWEII